MIQSQFLRKLLELRTIWTVAGDDQLDAAEALLVLSRPDENIEALLMNVAPKRQHIGPGSLLG
jgi:hypothetical protein